MPYDEEEATTEEPRRSFFSRLFGGRTRQEKQTSEPLVERVKKAPKEKWKAVCVGIKLGLSSNVKGETVDPGMLGNSVKIDTAKGTLTELFVVTENNIYHFIYENGTYFIRGKKDSEYVRKDSRGKLSGTVTIGEPMEIDDFPRSGSCLATSAVREIILVSDMESSPVSILISDVRDRCTHLWSLSHQWRQDYQDEAST